MSADVRTRPTLARAGLAGAALAVVAFASGSLILYEAAGALGAIGALAATFTAALAAGIWAGAPGARRDAPPTLRWIAAGAAVVVVVADAFMGRPTDGRAALGRVPGDQVILVGDLGLEPSAAPVDVAAALAAMREAGGPPGTSQRPADAKQRPPR